MFPGGAQSVEFLLDHVLPRIAPHLSKDLELSINRECLAYSGVNVLERRHAARLIYEIKGLENSCEGS